eukprot:Nitzschia sp. Nitz4//scaffold5_size260463//197221//200295//NITZ4_001010-RA/size260463-processed-gene-0.93-mRNA-1//1//CDS//3329555424//2795//frame0
MVKINENVKEVSEEEMEPVDEMSNDENDEEAPQQTLGAAGLLSKSWSVSSSHVPTFTGGTVTMCREHNWLLLPVHGDVAIVDATLGVKKSTLRGKSTEFGSGDDEEDEDEGLDRDTITAYAVDYNDQVILTCNRNLLLQQYSLDPEAGTTKMVKSWGKSGHTLPVTCMSFHISNVFLATGSVDGSVRIWDVRGSYVSHVFRPLAGGDGGGSGRLSVTAMAWRKDMGQLIIAIARDDGSITIHNLRDADNEAIVVVRDHVSAVTSMDWWGDEFFVSAGRDSMLNLWRIVPLETKSKKKKKNSRHTGTKKELAAVPHLEYRRIQSVPTYEQVEGLAVIPSQKHPNELRVATAGSRGVVRVWKANVTPGETPQLQQRFEQPKEQAFGEARGGYLGLVLNQKALADKNKKEQLISVDAEHNLTFLTSRLDVQRTLVGHNDEILDLAVLPTQSNRDAIVVATNSPQIRIFDLGNFSCQVLYGHTATVLAVTASPCGRYVASCGKDKTMRLWSVKEHRCLAIATGHTEPIGTCDLSSQVGRYEVRGKAAKNGGGAFGVTASADRTIKRWNLPGLDDLEKVSAGDKSVPPLEMEAATSVRAHDKDINIVSIAPNDSLIASGSQDKTIKLWNAVDLSLRATLKGHRRGVWDCQFSPIDRVLASSSADKTIKLWSLGDFSCVRTFQGHLASALRVRFLKTGLQLVSAGADGLIKLWTIRTNECEATLDGHSNKVWAMDIHPDGKKLISGGADSTLAVWEDNTLEVEEEKRATEAATILLDQQLANHMRHKEYSKALEIALQVDKPLQALRVINSIIEEEIKEGKGNGLMSLQSNVKSWDMDRVGKVLKYCRDWNTRARNATVAMLVVQAIVTVVPVDKLANTPGNPEMMAGIMPYAERHFERLERLYTSSYLLDFCLSNMGDFDRDAEPFDQTTFEGWEKTSKLVLPPNFVDGRIQVGGKTVVGKGNAALGDDDSMNSDDDDGVHTIGDSSSDESMAEMEVADDKVKESEPDVVGESSSSEDEDESDSDKSSS